MLTDLDDVVSPATLSYAALIDVATFHHSSTISNVRCRSRVEVVLSVTLYCAPEFTGINGTILLTILL
jgi:hypothetical protein